MKKTAEPIRSTPQSIPAGPIRVYVADVENLIWAALFGLFTGFLIGALLPK